VFVYHESIKRELKRRLIHEYRCDERLNKTKNEESTKDLKGNCVPKTLKGNCVHSSKQTGIDN
jgi:hypothetical protein